jgi:hypothetical protein
MSMGKNETTRKSIIRSDYIKQIKEKERTQRRHRSFQSNVRRRVSSQETVPTTDEKSNPMETPVFTMF